MTVNVILTVYLLCVFTPCLCSFHAPQTSVFSDGFNIKAATETKEDKLEQKQDQMESDLVDVNNTLAVLVEKIKSLESTKVSDSSSSQTVEKSFESFESAKQELTSKMSSLAYTVANVEESVKDVEQLREEVGSFATAQSAMTSQLSMLSDSVGQVEEGLKEVTQLRDQVGSVVSTQNDMTSKISSLSGSVGIMEENTRKVTQLKEEVGSVASAQSDMESQLSSLSKTADKVDDNVKEVTQLKKNVGTVASAQRGMESQMSSLSDSVGKVTENMKEVSQLKEEVGSVASAQSGLESHISSLSDSVGKVEENSKDVATIKKDVEDNKASKVETANKVASVINTLDNVQHALTKIKIDPTTCAEVQQCGGERVDGEFWLYPSVLGGERVKIFCSGMDTENPTEFVTLVNPNDGDYPNTHNSACSSSESTRNHPKKKLIGHVVFHKMRVNITTMEVIRNNRQYADVKGNPPSYGQARDCYTPLRGSETCGPKGYFNIDTKGTGMRVVTELTWQQNGYMGGAFVDRSEKGQVISIRCGGYCGGCEPQGGAINLELTANKVLAEKEVKEVKCPLYQPKQ